MPEKSVHEFDVIIEKDSEGFFVASVPELKGCQTQAKSLDVLMERISEAIELCWETGFSIDADTREDEHFRDRREFQ